MDFPSARRFGLHRSRRDAIALPAATAAQLAAWVEAPLRDLDPIDELIDADGLEVVFEPCDDDLDCYLVLFDEDEDELDEQTDDDAC